MVSTVGTYLSQEGFESPKTGYYYSREINTKIEATADDKFYNVTVDEFTYKDILFSDLDKVVEAIHKYDNTGRVVILYNLQRSVKLKHILPIKEDI